VPPFHEYGPWPDFRERARSVSGIPERSHAASEKGEHLVDVDGGEYGKGEEPCPELGEGTKLEKPSPPTRWLHRRIYDYRNVPATPQLPRHRADVLKAAKRSHFDGANVLMVEDLADLGRQTAGRFHVHRPNARGGLDRCQRDGRASEGARALKSANVGQNAGATPWIEPSHSESAAGLPLRRATHVPGVNSVT
jgi:hypothetical protein